MADTYLEKCCELPSLETRHRVGSRSYLMSWFILCGMKDTDLASLLCHRHPVSPSPLPKRLPRPYCPGTSFEYLRQKLSDRCTVGCFLDPLFFFTLFHFSVCLFVWQYNAAFVTIALQDALESVLWNLQHCSFCAELCLLFGGLPWFCVNFGFFFQFLNLN